LGISVDRVYGDVFHAEKATVLRETGAALYVGDHVADMQAGVLAGVPAIGVTSGPCSEADLKAAGATAVFADLHPLPEYLRRLFPVA
jgi:phosphoglycolate phosphatase